MAYKKPQDPLTNNGFGIYPLTTADQVILSDDSRLEKNGQISIGGGTVKTVSRVAPNSASDVLPVIFNGTQLTQLIYNGTTVEHLIYNGQQLY